MVPLGRRGGRMEGGKDRKNMDGKEEIMNGSV